MKDTNRNTIRYFSRVRVVMKYDNQYRYSFKYVSPITILPLQFYPILSYDRIIDDPIITVIEDLI